MPRCSRHSGTLGTLALGGWRRTVLGRQLPHRVGIGRRGQQVEGRYHHFRLAGDIARRPEGAPEDVPDKQDAEWLEQAGLVRKRSDVDAYRRYPALLEDPGGVSHGHMALGSGADQQRGIDPPLNEQVRPCGGGVLFQP